MHLTLVFPIVCHSKIKETNGEITYQAIKEEALLKKVTQLKNAMGKFKAKAAALEKELATLK